jgi:F-type H+-transporting ATPase subunit b
MIRKIEQTMTKLSSKLLLSLMAIFFVSSAALAADPVIVNDGEYFESDKAAHYAETDGLPQLDFTTYTPQIFWMFVFFALLYFIFSKKTLPDISGTIENRKNHIQSDLEAAEKLTGEADSVHDDYQENLAGSQNAASKTIQDMEGQMKTKAEKAMDDFRQRSEDEIKNAEERIMAAKQAAMGEMNQIVTEVTAEAVEKILGQSPDVNVVQSTVETLNETPKAKAA